MLVLLVANIFRLQNVSSTLNTMHSPFLLVSTVLLWSWVLASVLYALRAIFPRRSGTA